MRDARLCGKQHVENPASQLHGTHARPVCQVSSGKTGRGIEDNWLLGPRYHAFWSNKVSYLLAACFSEMQSLSSNITKAIWEPMHMMIIYRLLPTWIAEGVTLKQLASVRMRALKKREKNAKEKKSE